MHRCLTTKNGADISPQMFKNSRLSGAHCNIGTSAFVCTIHNSICTDALFRCISTNYFKTKRTD